MSQTFTDADLQTWEAFASGGKYGLSVRPRVVFHCTSDRDQRPRFVELAGDEADAEELVHESSVDRLRALLRDSRALD